MKKTSEITLPAELANLHNFIDAVRNAAKKLITNQGRIHDIELALEEALVNIINYAYAGQDRGNIEVRCGVGEDGFLVIEIADSGVPFDILSAAPPDLTADISKRKPGGLGIHFIKTLMDRVSYRREENKNILEFQVRPDA